MKGFRLVLALFITFFTIVFAEDKLPCIKYVDERPEFVPDCLNSLDLSQSAKECFSKGFEDNAESISSLASVCIPNIPEDWKQCYFKLEDLLMTKDSKVRDCNVMLDNLGYTSHRSKVKLRPVIRKALEKMKGGTPTADLIAEYGLSVEFFECAFDNKKVNDEIEDAKVECKGIEENNYPTGKTAVGKFKLIFPDA